MDKKMLRLEGIDDEFVAQCFQSEEIRRLVNKIKELENDESISGYERDIRIKRIVTKLETSVPLFRLREFPTKAIWENIKDINSRIRKIYVWVFNGKKFKFEKKKYEGDNSSVKEISREYNRLVNRVIDDPTYTPQQFQKDFRRWL